MSGLVIELRTNVKKEVIPNFATRKSVFLTATKYPEIPRCKAHKIFRYAQDDKGGVLIKYFLALRRAQTGYLCIAHTSLNKTCSAPPVLVINETVSA
jgi:hypothetical protein